MRDVEVVDTLRFENSNPVRVKGDPVGERLAKVSGEKNILPMGCDTCCYERQMGGKPAAAAAVGCLPNPYQALSGNALDQLITSWSPANSRLPRSATTP